jgi:hypothetical protein
MRVISVKYRRITPPLEPRRSGCCEFTTLPTPSLPRFSRRPLWLPGVFPCLFPPFPWRCFVMSDRDVIDAVAHVTGSKIPSDPSKRRA